MLNYILNLFVFLCLIGLAKNSYAQNNLTLEELQKKIDSLIVRVQELEKDIRVLQESNFQQELEINVIGDKDLSIGIENSSNEIDKKIYNEAFALLQKKDTIGADHKFAEFIEKFPKNKLISSAYYWRAEIHRLDQNYNLASKEFLEGYRANPQDHKAPMHLIKLASCLHALNREEVACKVIQKALQFYNTMNLNLKNEALELKSKIPNCI